MRVFATEDFSKECQKILSKSQQRQLETFMRRLRTGDQRGKVLGPFWLREVKLQEKRAYYLCCDTVALFIAVSTKKDQSKKIDWIRAEQDTLLRLLDGLSTR